MNEMIMMMKMGSFFWPLIWETACVMTMKMMIIYTYNDDEVDNYDDLVEVELDGWPGFLSSNAPKALFNHYKIFRVSSWRTPILFLAQLLLSSPSYSL